MISKLVIGTANFGLKYGIASQRKLSREQVFKVLTFAHAQGVWGVDTAKIYGEAEALLGEFFKIHGKVFKVITKLPKKEYLNSEDVEKEIFDSLNTMGISSIDILLIHSFETYEHYGKLIIPTIQSLCKEGVISNYGVSVYHPEEVEEVVNNIKGRVVIEFPLNLFDQRFLLRDYLKEIKDRGNFLFARSVFLQGLFFLKDESITGSFSKIKDNLNKIRKLAAEYHLKPECIALLFVIKRLYIDGVILGVDNKEHFTNNVGCLSEENYKKYRLFNRSLEELRINDEDIILPYRWNI